MKDSKIWDDLVTDHCDQNENWGPLLFLRPAPHERFTSLRVFFLSSLLGVLLGLLGSVLLAIVALLCHRAPVPLLVMPTTLTLTYFMVCQLTIVPAWNRRARRLAPKAG